MSSWASPEPLRSVGGTSLLCSGKCVSGRCPAVGLQPSGYIVDVVGSRKSSRMSVYISLVKFAVNRYNGVAPLDEMPPQTWNLGLCFGSRVDRPLIAFDPQLYCGRVGVYAALI